MARDLLPQRTWVGGISGRRPGRSPLGDGPTGGRTHLGREEPQTLRMGVRTAGDVGEDRGRPGPGPLRLRVRSAGLAAAAGGREDQRRVRTVRGERRPHPVRRAARGGEDRLSRGTGPGFGAWSFGGGRSTPYGGGPICRLG